MPVNYELITNEIEYQGLADLSVLVEDISSNSPDYFRVSNLPTEFTAGKNTFHFKGNPFIFQEGSSVYIEVLDSNGEALYYETALDLESEDQTAIVTVYVNESTPSGTAYIILCSTISNDIDGYLLDTSQINLRWSAPVYIDISKRNDSEIIFDVLPEITITPSTSYYTDLSYPGGSRFKSSTLGNLIYYYYNDTAVIVTDSNATIGFDTDSISGTVSINSNVLNNGYSGTIIEHYSSSFTVSDAGIIVLDDPISLEVQDSISRFEPDAIDITSADVIYEMSASGAQTTQNSNNLATVVFSNLQPQVGEVAKIRSYYRSAGIGEYILSNETDISDQATEFGFNADAVTTSFFLPTIHRNDKLDFKFEFINPIGLASKQVIESLDNSFPGGNTYIGGDDNLLTGSLYVAGVTGTGVHISGKGSSAMIRSIGYTGFQNAIGVGGKGGFVMYSGSVQSILGSAESYSGVGLELVANSSSSFKYTTSGSGLLDIRTNNFFLGSNRQFISGANGNIAISSSNFHLNANGEVSLTGNINISSGTGFATPAFVTSSIAAATSSLSSSINSRITSVSSSLNSTITSVSSSAAIQINKIVTDANNKIVKPNDTPSAGAGLYLSQNYLGYYSNSAWNAYISSSGEFLFKKDDNNQISFGNNAFVLKVSDAATISGSNINLITPNFFFGNASQFISGSNGNLRISSSNFFLGNTGGAFISGSNSNLRISASNFFIGNANTFLSSSNNKLEILNYDGVKTKFRLDSIGNVTASAFIAWTGSSDSTSQVMMNTAVGLVDGKNIGRALYQQTAPITLAFPADSSPSPMDSIYLQQWNAVYSTAACRSAINSASLTQPLSNRWLAYESIVDDFSYYALPFENTITIFGNIIVEKYSNYALPATPASLVLALRFTVWSPVTSSYASFGLAGNKSPTFTGTDVGYVAGVSGSIAYAPAAGAILSVPGTATLPTNTVANNKSVSTPFKATISIPSAAHDRLNIVNLDYVFFKMNNAIGVPGTEFYFNAKIANLTVMSSRTLASQASSGIGDFELNNYDDPIIFA